MRFLSLFNQNINSSSLSRHVWTHLRGTTKNPSLWCFFCDESGPGWRSGGPLGLIMLSRLWRYQSEKAEQQSSVV